MILFDTKKGASIVRIKVFGVGGGGCNIVDYMIKTGIGKVSFMAVNTDVQDLSGSLAKDKMQIGGILTGGLGAGAKPEVGREAAEESIDLIHEAVDDLDICIIVAGMGGGTGTGAAPIIAKVAKEQGKMVVAFVTTPFEYESKQRSRNALEGLDSLEMYVNSIIVIPNDKIFNLSTEDTFVGDAYNKIDSLLANSVRALTRLILDPGMVNLDFADVRSVLNIGGQAVITHGIGSGINKAKNAVDQALDNILIESGKLEGAKGILVCVVGGNDLTMHEVRKCIESLKEIANEDVNIISGVHLDDSMHDSILLSLIATGITKTTNNMLEFMINKTEERAFNQDVLMPPTNISNDTIRVFDNFGEEDEENLDIPTYIRRNKTYFVGS